MEITYKVEAKCNKTSGINVEFKGITMLGYAFRAADLLHEAFPIVDVVNEQTGEIMYSRYMTVDVFEADMEMGKAIEVVERKYLA
jgi:hypothetical protein